MSSSCVHEWVVRGVTSVASDSHHCESYLKYTLTEEQRSQSVLFVKTTKYRKNETLEKWVKSEMKSMKAESFTLRCRLCGETRDHAAEALLAFLGLEAGVGVESNNMCVVRQNGAQVVALPASNAVSTSSSTSSSGNEGFAILRPMPSQPCAPNTHHFVEDGSITVAFVEHASGNHVMCREPLAICQRCQRFRRPLMLDSDSRPFQLMVNSGAITHSVVDRWSNALRLEGGSSTILRALPSSSSQ